MNSRSSRWTLWLCAAFGAAPAHPAPAPAQEQAISLPLCRDHKGQPIAYRGLNTQQMRDLGTRGPALSFSDAGSPVIAYDHDRLAGTPEPFRNGVLAHECAHHEKGHVDIPQGEYDSHYQRYESEAECAGFLKLRRTRGYGLREIDIIVRTESRLFPADPTGQIRSNTIDRGKTLRACLKNEP